MRFTDTQLEEKDLPEWAKKMLGSRVAISRGHPHAGSCGEIGGFGPSLFGIHPVVRLDSGPNVFVMDPKDWRLLSDGGEPK